MNSNNTLHDYDQPTSHDVFGRHVHYQSQSST